MYRKLEDMTVRLAMGDVSGDPAPRSPATSPMGRDDACSPEHPLGGRFWALQLSDEEEDGDAEEVLSAGAHDPWRYLWQTPLSVSEIDISERPSELVRLALKRRNRQQSQREAAIDVIQFEDEGMPTPFSRLLGQSLPKIKNKPVLEPSIFMDDGSEGWK
jgi:hypothetical protein